MTSHWPTFADGLFWCACQNLTFPTEDEWLAHVVDSVLDEQYGHHPERCPICRLIADKPSETADELPHRGG